jgi:hypothetical protein
VVVEVVMSLRMADLFANKCCLQLYVEESLQALLFNRLKKLLVI